jgi:hypothetical protein
MQTHHCSCPRTKVDFSRPLVSSPRILSLFYQVPSGLAELFLSRILALSACFQNYLHFFLHVMLVLSSVFSSCRQFTFLWPGAKPSSMFLASF